jgi:protein disulfide isomerase
MRFATVVLVAAAIAAVAQASDVIDATDATFNDVISSSDFVLVEFYAPWCGHCKKLEPEFDAAAKELKGVAILAKLDATIDKEMGEKYEIKGFPTIKVFRGGELSGDYEGGRTAADFIAYVKANSGPALKTASTAEELAELKAAGAVTLVFQQAEASGVIFDAVQAAAAQLRSVTTFVQVLDAALFVGTDVIVLSKTFDDKQDVVYAGDSASTSELIKFVTAESVPVFAEIGPDNYKMYMTRGLPMAWMFVREADVDAKAAAAEAAVDFKGKLSFVWIDAEKYGGMAERLGLPKDQFPGFALDDEGKHFVFSEAITAENLKAFTAKFVAGELKTTLKTEAEPAEHTVKGLTTVVGTTFTALIAEADADVFIEFYAPWCGHCKQMAPAYEELAAELESTPTVVAKIDATANDYDTKMFDGVKGFPTLFWVPKATRVPVTFEGERTKDGMLTFIKEKTA